MTAGSILLATALLLVVGLYVFRPILTPSRTLQATQRDTLVAQKEALLDQIRALEFDHETGKVLDDDFQARRTDLVTQAADTLRQIDTLPESNSVDEQIEAAIARLRNNVTQSPPTTLKQATLTPKAETRFCTQCGKSAQSTDKFCANCGSELR